MEDKLKEFIEDVIDTYGESSVVTTESYLDNGVISTGSLALDVSLGIGGIPRGMYTEIMGPESSGKTTVALSIVKEAIKSGLSVMYLDAERSVDYRYVKAIIGEFDESKLTILSPKTAEDFFRVAEDGIASDLFQLIILDSLAGVSPEKEINDDLDKANVALLSRLLTKWLRRNSFDVKSKNIAFVFLNQVRDRIGTYVGGYESPGGHALKHFLAVKINFTKGGKLEVIGSDKKKEVVGIITKFTVSKNKLAAPFRSSTFPIIFGEGVDYYRNVIEFASSLGVVKRAGSYYRFEGETLGQGMSNAMETLKEDDETLDKIVKMCYNVIEVNKEISEEE